MNEVSQIPIEKIEKKANSFNSKPMLWAAAGAIGALSLALAGVGLSKVMGPSSPASLQTSEQVAQAVSPLAASVAPNAENGVATKPFVPLAATPSAAVAQPSQTKHRSTQAVSAAVKPRPTTVNNAPIQTAQAVNPNFGTVQSVRAVKQKGEGTGAGAVIGGVLGGVLGHQIGGGTGKDLATVGGAVGGGFLGHEVEKNVRAKTLYEVTVRMDNGNIRTFTQASPPASGSRVEVSGNSLRS